MRSIFAVLTLIAATSAEAQSCGGSFGKFVDDLKAEARSMGYPSGAVDAFFRGVQQDEAVLRADRRQGIFQKDFITFSRSLISQNRIDNAARNSQRYDATFRQIEREYGIPRGVLLAFWAFETDFGQVQGDFNTRNALVTLAHDCRRPEIFRPQVFAAIDLSMHGDFDPETTTGAWAGEIGQVQMLPKDIRDNGRDGDGDGHVTVKTSAPDALLSAGSMLADLGWQANQPWVTQITVPANLDWSETGINHVKSVRDWERLGVKARTGVLGNAGLQASVLLPVGHKGPAFLVYDNFRVYFEWNQSLTYVTTAAYFATRIMGAPIYDAGTPDEGLTGEQMLELQRKLAARGYDVGDIDRILGEKTREAVQMEQKRLGLPADAWPTPALLGKL